jgi:hypothetical protein
MKRADESKKLGPDSETTRVLHSQFADAMASGPVVADKN